MSACVLLPTPIEVFRNDEFAICLSACQIIDCCNFTQNVTRLKILNSNRPDEALSAQTKSLGLDQPKPGAPNHGESPEVHGAQAQDSLDL